MNYPLSYPNPEDPDEEITFLFDDEEVGEAYNGEISALMRAIRREESKEKGRAAKTHRGRLRWPRED
jgi:hypothetical protein